MSSYTGRLRKQLNKQINEMAEHPELYCRNPGRDFSRKGKLGLSNTVRILLSMEGKSLGHELREYFIGKKDAPSPSAFVQSRGKLNAQAMPALFHQFVHSIRKPLLYCGYRLLAVDGSTIRIPDAPENPDSLVVYSERQGWLNMLHLNVLYDLYSQIYEDVIIEGINVYNEQNALITMIDRAEPNNVILIADRGYESYNVLGHLQHKGWKYLIRIRDHLGLVSGLNLPADDEFDCQINLCISHRRTKETNALFMERNRFKRVDAQRFDYDFFGIPRDGFFLLSFRIVRFLISVDSYETVITNLDADAFPLAELKRLYSLRWGIETSFRHLKHTLGLLHFHAKKVEYIHQEIYARLIMYNFCALVSSHIAIRTDRKKYAHKPNFSAAVQVCRQFFRGDVSPPVLEALISSTTSPIRPDRSFPRTPSARGMVSFAYRIA